MSHLSRKVTRRSSSRGVTLIELLVVITLISIVTIGLLSTLQMGVNGMERVKEKFDANRRALSAQQILESQIGGVMAAEVKCSQQAGGEGTLPALYFAGSSSEMRMVSAYSIQHAHRGPAMALDFKVIPGESGGVRLIVNERPYAGAKSLRDSCVGLVADPQFMSSSAQFRPIEIGSWSFVLADKLAACRFVFLRRNPFTQKEEWLERWGGDQLPAAIRVEMLPLNPLPGRVPLLTVTMPVRVTKSVGILYKDFDDAR
jgi:prepilin-type N-terminal cleavage/methylation domain-containing protein